MHYASLDLKTNYNFFISVHDPNVDIYVSKGIKEGLFGPKDKHPSVDELHAVCEHGAGPASPLRASCGGGRVFVEVGSAIGMVSLYAANRGMKVYAFDPLTPNTDRISESLCLNGERKCAPAAAASTATATATPAAADSAAARGGVPAWCERAAADERAAEWGEFSPSYFSVLNNLVGSEDGAAAQAVRSEPNNLAATMRGWGSVETLVKMVTIDSVVPETTPIEIILLTCQGHEYDALRGATRHIEAGLVRHVIWRRHNMLPEHDAKAANMVTYLQAKGYQFYNLEESRRDARVAPAPIPAEKVMDYVMQTRSIGDHPNILASLPTFNPPPPPQPHASES